MTLAKAKKGEGNGQALDVKGLTNDAEFGIGIQTPYTVDVTLEGTTSIIFNRFSVEKYLEQRESKKGSRVRTENDPETALFRCEDGTAGIPAEHVYRAMINAATTGHGTASPPRASAMQLYKAGVVVGPEIASLGKPTWDYLDQRRAVVNRAAVPRLRPAFLAGWRADFAIDVLLPELIAPVNLMDVLNAAGRFSGLAEMRPTYGRFHVVRFEVAD